jgi:hypothetical protein
MERAQAVIQAQQHWAQAVVSNDADRIAACQANEWSIVTKNGITSGETFLRLIREGALRHSRMDPVGKPL